MLLVIADVDVVVMRRTRVGVLGVWRMFKEACIIHVIQLISVVVVNVVAELCITYIRHLLEH